MLKVLRNKKTAKKVWIGLALVIIPAFTLWGFGGAMRSKEENKPIGKIYGHNVTDLEFKKALAGVRTTAIMQFGEKLPEVEKYLNLPAQAWDRLLLLYEAKRRNITIDDKEVIDLIQSAPYFNDKAGFNNRAYEETLHYTFHLQPRSFEEQMRENLILSKLHERITGDIKVTEEQVREEYLKINEELNINYVAAFFADFAKKIKPTDKEIAEFYEINKAMFKELPAGDKKEPYTPELAQIKDKVKEALIRASSQKTAESKIKECQEKLKKLNFTKAAKACGLKSGSTAFFKSSGQIKELGNGKVFWDTARKLSKNQNSAIFPNDNGYYIISLKSVKPIDEKEFEEARSDFSKSLLSAKKNEAFAKFIQEIELKSR